LTTREKASTPCIRTKRKDDKELPNNKSSAVAEMAAQCCTSRIFGFEWGWGYLFLAHFFPRCMECKRRGQAMRKVSVRPSLCQTRAL